MAAAQRSRLAMVFESKEASRQRNMINTTTKKRSPVGKLDNKIFEREKLKEEVESYPNGMVVNWSDLARRHNIQNTKGELAKNGGQIAQEWLKSGGGEILPGLSKNTMEILRKSGGRNLGDKGERSRLQLHKLLIL